ncbi:MAG: bifunctional diaminohydroxyphosphoribosylaminopyrimidine deaminase/5-amino-6-(5-phosphoribosylamino)uracil reductase RibD [Bacteroidia bacterium]
MNSSEQWMQRCLELAIKGEGFVEPNPLVGCIIVHGDKMVAEGYHETFGEAHAEVNAIKNLSSELDPSECTLYINLEPCSHHGKTPPCADLIIEKGFAKVVIGDLDPNPKVAGGGLAKLKQAGIDTQVGVLSEQCRQINRRFYYYHTHKRPYITLKWAETANGFIGRHRAELHLSKQVSSNSSKAFVHHLRAIHRSIMIGSRTANQDNPKLTVRDWVGRNPLKLIVSKSNTINDGLQMFKEGETWIFNTLKEDDSDSPHYVKIKFHGFLENMFRYLHDQGIQSVLVEGGAELAQGLIDHNLWDEAYVIKSDVVWERGVKAPILNASINREENIGHDKISTYINS